MLKFGPYMLDVDECYVQRAGQHRILLTRFEAKVLGTLAMASGQVVTRCDINVALYGSEPPARAPSPNSNCAEVFVRRLRAKLDPANIDRPIETVRGQGYRLRKWEDRVAA